MTVSGVSGFSSPWPDWQKPVRSLADVRRRVDDYDKSLGSYWAESSLPWIARNVAGEVGHQYYSLPKDNPFFQALPKEVASWTESKVSYGKLLGIRTDTIEKAADVTWREFLGDKDVQGAYKQLVRENFEEFKFTPIKPSQYLKHVVMQYNVGRVVEDLKHGRIFPAMAKTLGISTLLYEVLSNTQKRYLEAKRQEDGTIRGMFKTWGVTLVGLIKETAKSVAAWELTSVGYLIGQSVFCIGVIPSMIAGCILGGLLGAGFKSILGAHRPNDAHDEQSKTWALQSHPSSNLNPSCSDYPPILQSPLNLTG